MHLIISKLQHFQRLAGQHRSLFAKAKRGAVQGTIDPNFNNDSDGADDICEADDDPEDDTASAHDGIGAAPTSSERRTNSGQLSDE